MSLKSSLQTFEHRYFYSMNDKDDPQVLDNLRAANIENWLIRDLGQLTMRKGITARGTSPSATNLGAAVLYRTNGRRYAIRVVNGAANTSKFQHSEDLVTWTDSSGGGSLRTDTRWSFVQANDYLYGVNGIDTPIRFDGTTVTTVAAIPNGTAIEWFKNFMWVIGVAATPDRLYFSNANTPETWGGSDFINVNLGDASPGTGLRGQAGSTGRLYVGKQRSVWYLTGTSSSNFAIQPLTYEHGVASHESMIQVSNDVWCIDMEGNVRGLYRTTEDNPFSRLVSEDIQTTIAGLNKSAMSKASAVYYDNYAIFFVPNGVDSQNSLTLVYDTLANEEKGGWLKFTGWSIARAVVFQETTPKLVLHDSRTGNGQTYEWTGTADNGIAITAKYETKIYDHGFPERRKKWKFAYQFAPALGSVNVRFYVSIDRYYYVLLKTFSLAGTGNKLLGVNWTLGTDKLGSGGFVQQKIRYQDGGGENTGYTQQVKIEAESSTTQIKMRQFTSHFRVKGLR